MITLKQWLEIADYKITEGNHYLWDCYGKDAHSLSSWNGIHGKGGYDTDIKFDTKTQTVYEVAVHDFTNERAYRMINPSYADAHAQEAKTRGIDINNAWDGVEYTDLDVEQDFIEKATAIVNGQDYDKRVMMQVNLDLDTELELYRNAHRLDITANDYINLALAESARSHGIIPTLTEEVKTHWTLTFEEDENGDFMLKLPDDLLKMQGWKEGDTLNWTKGDDGSLIIEKI